MSDELKPCPFCGHSAIIREQFCSTGLNRSASSGKFTVHCVKCNAEMTLSGRKNAINAWNKRAKDKTGYPQKYVGKPSEIEVSHS